jgi:hypothetical protein
MDVVVRFAARDPNNKAADGIGGELALFIGISGVFPRIPSAALLRNASSFV